MSKYDFKKLDFSRLLLTTIVSSRRIKLYFIKDKAEFSLFNQNILMADLMKMLKKIIIINLMNRENMQSSNPESENAKQLNHQVEHLSTKLRKIKKQQPYMNNNFNLTSKMQKFSLKTVSNANNREG